MRALVLAAVLVAGPAWAGPDDSLWHDSLWHTKAELCAAASSHSYAVCKIMHAPSEAYAVDLAAHLLKTYCGSGAADLCAEVRTYIKRRWAHD